VSRFVRPVPWYALAVLYAAVPVAASKQWLHRGWALPQDYVATRTGFWRRRTHVVPDDRVQTVIDRRSLFQRRWGLATLYVDTASSGGFIAEEAKAIDVTADRASSLRQAVTDRLIAALGLADRD
jgi:putative membrane protein